ncbi:MAG: hypothetical protein M3R52_06340 [Acidobacteriota bacterium]|nr:hypothetical protein [Acidobacteriota bacterium]
MAELEVEDLIRSIRERAREEAAQQTEPSLSPQDSTAAKPLARLQTSLTITGRTHDQLPPVTTYRSGFLARVELWIKRLLKRASHWYTWEQVNFNSSVHSALNNSMAIFQTYEQRLASLQNEVDAGLASKANLEARLAELESRLALIERRFDGLLAEEIAEIRIEHQKDIELLMNEQRVCFKQLVLKISEEGVIADRAKRSIQLRLEELAGRLDMMSAEQHEVNTVGREIADNRDLL